MSYSFSSLLSSYSKHLELYFSSVCELEEDLNDFANGFHTLLVCALEDYAESMSDRSSKIGGLSGRQVSHMIPQLITAEKEAIAEVDLRDQVRKYFYPSYFARISGGSRQVLSSEVTAAIAAACPCE
jgi:hypothetical protein